MTRVLRDHDGVSRFNLDADMRNDMMIVNDIVFRISQRHLIDNMALGGMPGQFFCDLK